MACKTVNSDQKAGATQGIQRKRENDTFPGKMRLKGKQELKINRVVERRVKPW